MQSENFDKKIRDSLSQRPPGNEPPEWDKMEKLLDKHMPLEKKDRRRVFFILFLFLLLGGGAFIIWNSTNNGNKQNITASKPTTENSTSIDNNTNSTDRVTETNSTKTETINKELPQSNSKEIPLPVKSSQSSKQQQLNIKSDKTVLPATEKPITGPVAKTRINEKINKPGSGTIKPNKQKVKEKIDNEKAVTVAQKSDQQKTDPIVAENQEPKTDEPQKLTEEKKSEELTKQDVQDKPGEQKAVENKIGEQKQTKPEKPQQAANKKTQKQKDKSSFVNNLFFSVSAGADFSTVGLNETGKLKAEFGAGIGYQVSKKFAVRTGFYTGRKVYTADPKDYNPPSNFWSYYPNLKSIDADCKVYEIPVVIDYTISQNKKQSWFVSAGLSSLLMKKETYEYYYKPNTSPTYVTYSRTIENQNKHYFSVLNLSGGYTRNISKSFSLRAEPYAKVALGGIGYGKVKLNSGGVLISAIIKPFAKK